MSLQLLIRCLVCAARWKALEVRTGSSTFSSCASWFLEGFARQPRFGYIIQTWPSWKISCSHIHLSLKKSETFLWYLSAVLRLLLTNFHSFLWVFEMFYARRASFSYIKAETKTSSDNSLGKLLLGFPAERQRRVYSNSACYLSTKCCSTRALIRFDYWLCEIM